MVERKDQETCRGPEAGGNLEQKWEAGLARAAGEIGKGTVWGSAI